MKKIKRYLTALNNYTNIIILTLVSITLFYFGKVLERTYITFNDEYLKSFSFALVLIVLLLIFIFDLTGMLISINKRMKVNLTDSLNYSLLLTSTISFIYFILEYSNKYAILITNSIFLLLFFEMFLIRIKKYKPYKDETVLTNSKSIFSYFTELLNKYNIFIVIMFSAMFGALYRHSIYYVNLDLCVIIGLINIVISLLLMIKANNSKINYRDLCSLSFIVSSIYLIYTNAKIIKGYKQMTHSFDIFNINPFINKYLLVIIAILLMVINIFFIIYRSKKVKTKYDEYDNKYNYKVSFKHYIREVDKHNTLIFLTIISILYHTIFAISFANFSEYYYENDFDYIVLLIQIVTILYLSISNNNKTVTLKDYFLLPALVGYIMVVSCNWIFKQYDLLYFSIIFSIILFITIIFRIKTVKCKLDLIEEETIIDNIETIEVIEDTQNDEVTNEIEQDEIDESIEEDLDEEIEVTEKVEIIPEIDIYEFTDVRNIDKYVYSHYFDYYYEYLSRNSIQILNIEDEHHINTLLSVFNSLNSLNDLENLLNECGSLIKKSEQLGLLHYEVLAMYKLKSLCNNINEEIIKYPQYFIVNYNDTYYNRLSKYSTNEYIALRSSFFIDFLKKCNNLDAITILCELYSEVRCFFENKVNKKVVRSTYGSLETSGFFDLYLLDLNYDYAKSKRQATKFLSEYDLCKDNQTQKLVKEFIDNLHKSEYIDTIIPFLAIFSKNIASHRRLFFEMCTKINLISITSSKHFLYDKFINVLVQIMISYHDPFTLTNDLFEVNNDYILLDTFIRKVQEMYGTTHKYCQYIVNKMASKITSALKQDVVIYNLPKYSKEYIYILYDYSTKNQMIKQSIVKSIKQETVFKFLESFVSKTKEDSTYHYEIDIRFMQLFITKNDIIKIIKDIKTDNKTLNQKYNVVVELIKNKTFDTRLNIDFQKL